MVKMQGVQTMRVLLCKTPTGDIEFYQVAPQLGNKITEERETTS